MDLRFEVSNVMDEQASRQILEGLMAYNTSRFGASEREDLLLTVKDSADGELKAGLKGMTHFGWLYVQQLWVADSARGEGVGTRLMQMAESEARRRGCCAAYVDTFSFQALDFYRKLGFETYGELENFPRGHQRLFLRKYFPK